MSDQRARLFAALELPPVARDTLARWASEQLEGMPAARRLEPESFHVTLCFLGSQTVEDVAEIARACRVVGSQDRVVLTLGPALWLPERRPRALAVGLEDDNAALMRLQSTLSRSLQAGGWYEPERRPFLGHVTVARIATGGKVPVAALPSATAGTVPVAGLPPATRGKAPVAALPTPTPLPALPPLRFVSAAVTLYRSHLGPRGARYQPLETVGLSG